MLAGSDELIDEAWRYKHMMGGALRSAQSNIVVLGVDSAAELCARLEAEHGVLMGALGPGGGPRRDAPRRRRRRSASRDRSGVAAAVTVGQ